MKVAIVGGGPSGFYVASRLLSLLRHPKLRVHIYDRLWAPHGLVRYGVAPDHPEVKNCTNKFDQTAQDPRFQFFGNVNISSPSFASALNVSLDNLRSSYSHLIFATGCTESTLHASLPPSSHVIPALSLVQWYTAHPSALNMTPPSLSKTEHVSLIGNGNVSMDIARMLLTPVDKLRGYDIPEPVMQTLSESKVKHVSIFARRGPLQAAFTTKELRELMVIPGCSMVPLGSDLLAPPPELALTRQQLRVMDILKKGSKSQWGSTPNSFSLDFYRSPVGITLPPRGKGKASLSLAHTMVDPATGSSIPCSETTTIPTDLVVTSIGFHAAPTTPFFDPGLNHLRTVGGRVVSADGELVPNTYASGWASTGPKGVIAKTLLDAYAVADTVLDDLTKQYPEISDSLTSETEPNIGSLHEDVLPEIADGVKNGQVTTYHDWKRVDEEEQRRGTEIGKERERMIWDEAHKFLQA